MHISVIIPTYQPQDYLWTCLNSLAAQTLPASRWEALLVLNGPKEPYFTSIMDFIAQLPIQIHLIYSNKPGVSNARNVGLDNAIGDYITFIDDDDYVSPSFLSGLQEKASPNIVSLCNIQAFSDEHPHLPCYFEDAYGAHAQDGVQPFYHARKYFSSSCLKLIHRDIIGNRRFSEHYSNGEDSLFMFLISDRLTFVQFTSTEAVYFRRVRLNSASHSTTKWQQLGNCARLMKEYTRIYCHGHYLFRFYFTRLLGAIHTMIE